MSEDTKRMGIARICQGKALIAAAWRMELLGSAMAWISSSLQWRREEKLSLETVLNSSDSQRRRKVLHRIGKERL